MWRLFGRSWFIANILVLVLTTMLGFGYVQLHPSAHTLRLLAKIYPHGRMTATAAPIPELPPCLPAQRPSLTLVMYYGDLSEWNKPIPVKGTRSKNYSSWTMRTDALLSRVSHRIRSPERANKTDWDPPPIASPPMTI